MNWNLKNIETILISFFLSIVLISSSSISVTINETTDFRNLNLEVNKEEQSINRALTGLAPRVNKEKSIFKTALDEKNELKTRITSNNGLLSSYRMYGFNAYASGIWSGPCYFSLDDPGNITLLNTAGNDFCSGGTWTFDDKWICCEYGSGALWEIDPDDGTMTSIGGGGQPMNGLSYNPINDKMYGVGGTDGIYLVDYETGETEYVGSGGTGQTMIALAFDANGDCYSWDVKFSGDSYLYEVDIETGAFTQIGSMGKTLCYAQDGDFLFAEDRLILTAYIYEPEYGGYLCEVNKETAELTILGEFEGSAEIDASMFQNTLNLPEHDVGLRQIIKPQDSGNATQDIPMQVEVRNYGKNPETTDVNMQVIKYEDGPIIFNEDFSGAFPPEGWTTDYWTKSNTSNTCGESPEARCNKFTQYNNSDYYDNYIMTPFLNYSDIKALKFNFKFSCNLFDLSNGRFYVKYRKDSTGPWTDITPWDNPLKHNINCEIFEINIFGDPYIGEEFQIKWEYIGFYYQFNDFYLDDVKITIWKMYEEYNETVEDVEIPVWSEVIVDFPLWMPSDWQDQNYENTWQEYEIKAYTLLDDYFPKNDYKMNKIDLYFPWMHDIKITRIDSPYEYGPGKKYPVQATIKNIGQYPECCIPINISIGEPIILGTILSEDSWDAVPPSGWTDQHKNYATNYGWNKSNTSYSGGNFPEVRLPYYHALPNYVFYSYAIDTTEFSIYQLDFLSYINHYSEQGLYTLEAGYSNDGEKWYAIWSEAPRRSGRYTASVQFYSQSETTYIGFWVKGNPWYMNYWYIDNVSVKVIDFLEVEYFDYMCHGPDLEPGETRVFEFDDWTPDFLQYETTGSKNYLIKAEIDMEGDNNTGNDILNKEFTLDYWHDSSIKELISPNKNYRDVYDWLHFDDGTTFNALGATCACTFEYAIRLTPEELAPWEGYEITTVKRHHSWIKPFQMSGKIKIYAQGTPTKPGELITVEPFSCYEADWHDIKLTYPVYINGNEDIWVSCEVTHLAGEYPAGMDPSNNYPGKGDWIYLHQWVEASIYGFYCDWNLWAGVGPEFGCEYVYIKPGVQDINVTVENCGTFPELGLNCSAEMNEYITNCTNGTLVLKDNILDIDLETPLGGTEYLSYNNFNFEKEGLYSLILNLTDENDDIPYNNKKEFRIVVDDSSPYTNHIFNPAAPDGKNGWYESDVEVTLDATDPRINCSWGSGVKEIRYKIGSDSWKTIVGRQGNFVLDEDGENIHIQYYAIDNVGNEEQINSFTINIDHTNPIIDLTFEWTNSDNPGSWWMIYTANATDATSKMDRVEFYLNDVIQDTVTGPGPEYIWKFLYSGGLNIIIKTEAYDKAGNMADDMIIDPEGLNVNLQQYHSSKILQLIQKTSYKQLVLNNKIEPKITKEKQLNNMEQSKIFDFIEVLMK
ncbi:hypothetical protein AYK24_10145 [Thermoplasmatales archaeon SG8-52-4]|nr:MAG: hypothetical protein AYK24_10145 [Thermoplasmatales archaeon SG8-52-4]